MPRLPPDDEQESANRGQNRKWVSTLQELALELGVGISTLKRHKKKGGHPRQTKRGYHIETWAAWLTPLVDGGLKARGDRDTSVSRAQKRRTKRKQLVDAAGGEEAITAAPRRGHESLDEATTRWKAAQADTAEVKLEALKGSLVPRDELERALQERAVEFTRALRSMARRAARAGVGIESERALYRLLLEEVDTVVDVYRRPPTEFVDEEVA